MNVESYIHATRPALLDFPPHLRDSRSSVSTPAVILCVGAFFTTGNRKESESTKLSTRKRDEIMFMFFMEKACNWLAGKEPTGSRI